MGIALSIFARISPSRDAWTSKVIFGIVVIVVLLVALRGFRKGWNGE